MSVRPDDRLADAPMMPVSCAECGATVLARKSSWEQTSVQWDAAATGRCVERRQTREQATELRSGVFLMCSRLRVSIEMAVRAGTLLVLDGV
ncbi:ferredoxin [Mycolicibacterium wolinskyi]|uniref:Ferredoxin n=1 Tax=Mycolicibacterium wolinskyi TaxID=59750 RepID=A0A1X2FAP4_9MYCO|nr:MULTISPECIES: ferredoxin [Mycolicibacterium]MCV7285523.1 ferredoxin [Mycolicibacterium wolinskyi]MCV7291446.1 ferredoxin [Mycolicibacterium goodii]ORX15477.1 ferredoxin [Mycolicibacterium wolinskyi]